MPRDLRITPILYRIGYRIRGLPSRRCNTSPSSLSSSSSSGSSSSRERSLEPFSAVYVLGVSSESIDDVLNDLPQVTSLETCLPPRPLFTDAIELLVPFGILNRVILDIGRAGYEVSKTYDPFLAAVGIAETMRSRNLALLLCLRETAARDEGMSAKSQGMVPPSGTGNGMGNIIPHPVSK